MRKVRASTSRDVSACMEIVSGLPDHFTPDVPRKVEAHLRDHDGWVVTEADAVVAFAVAERRSDRAAEILWIAVEADRRGEGIGTLLVDRLIGELADDGVRVIEAKSLDRSADYEPYVATRAFWERSGFVQIDTIDPLPGWEAGNPAAIYVAAIGGTR